MLLCPAFLRGPLYLWLGPVQPRVEAAGDPALAISFLQWKRELRKKLDALIYQVLGFNTPYKKNYIGANKGSYCTGVCGRV